MQNHPVSLGRYLFWGAAATALAAVLAWSFLPARIPVDAVPVVRAPMTVAVTGEGRTRVKDIYTLSAPVAGRLLRIPLRAGDAVTRGQADLAVIQPAEPAFLDTRARAEAEATARAAADALDLARADLDRARAELTFAKTELVRARTLSGKGTIAARALDKAVLDADAQAAAVRSAEATVEVRRHELETARARLTPPTGAERDGACCVAVTSPVDGRVLRVLEESEQVVAAGTPLLEVGDPRDLEVVVELLTTDAAQIREGADAAITGWGGEPLQGRVRRIEPFGYTKTSVLGIEEQRVDVLIDFAPSAVVPERLGHGFRVDVAITAWRKDGVLTAPLSALFRDGGGWAAYAVEDGRRARLVPLGVGRMNGEAAEILSGVGEGEVLVEHPSDRIADGAPVRVRED
ncbi:MAG: HlyD family efflux transporter periplasmic adaptor subunit [Alphaproteobacteria bacterium]|nr:HlyD family efflux transporter periplasmic adaptor subunit [Alphaproteobacteria bacterium]